MPVLNLKRSFSVCMMTVSAFPAIVNPPEKTALLVTQWLSTGRIVNHLVGFLRSYI